MIPIGRQLHSFASKVPTWTSTLRKLPLPPSVWSLQSAQYWGCEHSVLSASCVAFVVVFPLSILSGQVVRGFVLFSYFLRKMDGSANAPSIPWISAAEGSRQERDQTGPEFAAAKCTIPRSGASGDKKCVAQTVLCFDLTCKF